VFTERTSVGLSPAPPHARAPAEPCSSHSDRVDRRRDHTAGVHVRVGQLTGPVSVTYEAGPTGFGLARAFAAAGVRCVVAAPSKIVRPAGDRVKTDAKDALLLARLLRMDEIVPVRVPTVTEEATRDLVRAREDARADLMASRHRLSKLLLRHGHGYSGGAAWTGAHDQWLRRIRFDQPGTQAAFDSAYADIVFTVARRD